MTFSDGKRIRVAVVGIGAMGQGIVSVLGRSMEIDVVAVADVSKKALETISPYVPEHTLMTTDPQTVFSRSPDVLVEATATIPEAVFLVRQAIQHRVHVILMNSEVDQTFGYLLAKEAASRGVILTSDAGDQHGVLVRLISEVRRMGFEIVMAGNVKGFLDRHANSESIVEEAAKRRLSLKQCVAYTDGTKLAIEMALVANAEGFNIMQTGMVGPRTNRVQDALDLFDLSRARSLGGVVDYLLGAEPGGSVFVIGYSNNVQDNFFMDYYKMGKGPYYLFLRPYHVCHFETPLTIQRIMKYHEPILVQRRRVLEVGCRAKTDLQASTKLEGIGGHHIYGVLEQHNTLPIGMVENTIILKSKKKDEPIFWDDVEFPKNDPRLGLWRTQAGLSH